MSRRKRRYDPGVPPVETWRSESSFESAKKTVIMRKQVIFPVFIALFISFLSCKNEPEVREQAKQVAVEQVAEENANRSRAEGKIVTLTYEKVTLDNTSEFDLPSKDDKESCTIFFVRNAETMDGKTALSDMGRARAGLLAQVLGQAGFAQAYSDKSNSSMQTALMTAQANGCELNFFQPETTSVMLSTIVHSFKGKRVLVTGSAETVASMLFEISGENRYKVPADEYDNLFIVKAKEVGKGEVKHVKY